MELDESSILSTPCRNHLQWWVLWCLTWDFSSPPCFWPMTHIWSPSGMSLHLERGVTFRNWLPLRYESKGFSHLSGTTIISQKHLFVSSRNTKSVWFYAVYIELRGHWNTGFWNLWTWNCSKRFTNIRILRHRAHRHIVTKITWLMLLGEIIFFSSETSPYYWI